MPRVFRKAKTRTCNWGERHRRTLERGGAGFSTPIEFTGDDADENLRRAWEVLGPEIMAQWDSPGKRPAAWWVFDSPEPRSENVITVSEAEQLDKLGLLDTDELISLSEMASAENERLHRNSRNAGGEPFRRSWLFWKFIEKRDPNISEAQQLMDLDAFHQYERDIVADPQGAMAGRVGCTRTRFYYLDESEQTLLDLPHKSL